MAEIDKRLQHLLDRQEILDCLTRESRGRDRHDAELTRACYWDDGFDEHRTFLVPGPEFAQTTNDGHVAKCSANTHAILNHTCEIVGDVAYCETYSLTGHLSLDEKTCLFGLGRFIDQLERRNGEWRIQLRRCILDMAWTADASWLHSPVLAGFLKGARSKDDLSYQRPLRLPEPADERW